jgi:hypothetical protein
MTVALYTQLLEEELAKLEGNLPYDRAATLLSSLVTQQEFVEFLTLPGYQQIA